MKNENRLIEEAPPSVLEKFVSQLNNPFTFVLFAAAAISLLLSEYSDVIVILAVVIFNGVFGVIQEGKAEHALAALKKMTSPTALIRKGGTVRRVPAVSLEPGDVVLLEAGDQVPADIQLTEASHLAVEESALTGESLPVHKSAGQSVFMSTLITDGRGEGVVTKIGMDTEIGKIAALIHKSESSQTPLQKRLGKLGKSLSILALVLCALLFALALAMGRDVPEMLVTAISLAVAAVPEGLPAIVTIVLAIGVSRLASAGTIVRKMPSVETLGSVSVVCSDKTGTLTQNRMTVTAYYENGKITSASERKPSRLLDGFVLCNNAILAGRQRIGDPTELALLDWAASHKVYKEALEIRYPRVDEQPFSSEARRMATRHKKNGRLISYIKGASDVVLAKCTELASYGSVKPLTASARRTIEQAVETMSGEGLRVLALAEDNVFLGLVGMKDPVRPESLPAIRRFREAGIQTVMITGDHKNTAFSIAKELELADQPSQCLTGEELDRLSDEELEQKITNCRVFARVSPGHKVRIVKAFQKSGHLAAMTGDGVNDAPSLKTADIGIAMGKCGTDVAKGAADMILTDDNFATIEKAIAGGRGIYENIRKSVLFLLSSNFGEIMTMFTAVAAGLAVPLQAIHILWVNLITDSLPALALGMDKNEDALLMHDPPRDPEESLMAHGGWFCTCFYGFLIAGISLFAFLMLPVLMLRQMDMELTLGNLRVALETPAVLARAQTYAFTTLGVSQLFHAIGMRNQRKSIFEMNHLQNPMMFLALFLGLGLQAAVTEIPVLIRIFGTAPLALHEWGFLLALSAVPLFAHQLLLLRKSGKKKG
ncbi:cation-translocating P-type ATPase [Cuneatibacter sp. NSJ-177]|uniref:cation-translocating P-type ATPase n=1 Tax=Cuneatibacter sp. NSJ-177 TaxID=2931401 RepID=UPI001FD25CC4|nr:cation-translocating P-type ATPase [Cuneatibacter sp. NSJ-177]MCJ7833856.1 cation-translocating P-type ATPase [Cuneatibacter sp. NSJ-177]